MVGRAWAWIAGLEDKSATGAEGLPAAEPPSPPLANAHPLGTMPKCPRSVSSRTFNPPATSPPRSKPWRAA